MKYIAWLISAVNIYLGFYYLLNVIGILQSSKYSKASTAIFAILLPGMGISGLYMALAKNNYKLALLIEIGPWIVILVILLFSMMTADHK